MYACMYLCNTFKATLVTPQRLVLVLQSGNIAGGLVGTYEMPGINLGQQNERQVLRMLSSLWPTFGFLFVCILYFFVFIQDNHFLIFEVVCLAKNSLSSQLNSDFTFVTTIRDCFLLQKGNKKSHVFFTFYDAYLVGKCYRINVYDLPYIFSIRVCLYLCT